MKWKTDVSEGEEWEYSYYFNWWNPLPKGHRVWGYDYMVYDCVRHNCFSFYFFNISWAKCAW